MNTTMNSQVPDQKESLSNARAFNYYAMLRFNQEPVEGSMKKLNVAPAVYLLDQQEMSEVFEHSKNGRLVSIANTDKYWTKIELIQTNIRAIQGCGAPIIVNFYAPIDKRDPMKQIDYDFRALGEDEDLIRGDPEMYCLKQVYKYCYFISKLHQIEIIRMKCEFAQDFHGSIWFQYASQIFVRPNIDAKKAMNDEIERIKRINQAHREKLVCEIEEHKNQDEQTSHQVR
jgi:hypothetical protein